jgi:hypothetical protein
VTSNPTSAPTQPCFTVVFRPTPGGIDGVKRLRHLLKVAGRRFGLIAVHVEETSAPALQLDPRDDSDGGAHGQA